METATNGNIQLSNGTKQLVKGIPEFPVELSVILPYFRDCHAFVTNKCQAVAIQRILDGRRGYPGI